MGEKLQSIFTASDEQQREFEGKNRKKETHKIARIFFFFKVSLISFFIVIVFVDAAEHLISDLEAVCV